MEVEKTVEISLYDRLWFQRIHSVVPEYNVENIFESSAWVVAAYKASK